MSSFAGKKVLVTGGSSGIGLDLARLFMKDKARVALVGSNADKLNRAALLLEKEFSTRPLLFTKDFANPQSPFSLLEELKAHDFQPDVLVNSAGFGAYGLTHEMDLEKITGMIHVNVTSFVVLTRLLTPSMVEKRSGYILNVASTAAFQALPKENIYAATKAFVLLFSEALAEELRSQGVGVTCLCPGATDTPFFLRGTIGASRIIQANMMKSDEVARIGYNALKRRKPLVVAGFTNKIATWMERFIPRRWAIKVGEKVIETRYDAKI